VNRERGGKEIGKKGKERKWQKTCIRHEDWLDAQPEHCS